MKISIPMSRLDWVAAEHLLWRAIRGGRDITVQEYLLKAYDKKKMLLVDAKNKKWSLEPHIAMMVARQIEVFLQYASSMDESAYDFAKEYESNLNRIANEIRRQQITIR